MKINENRMKYQKRASLSESSIFLQSTGSSMSYNEFELTGWNKIEGEVTDLI